MHWQRLDRDTSINVIDSVKSDANAGLFSAGTSEVKRAALPFYKNYYLYKVTNFASLPSFSFQYLSDGKFFHYLDGTEDPIHRVNDKGDLGLDKNNVISYLSFFFEQVSEDEGDILVISNPHDMPMLESLDADAYAAAVNHHKPAEVNYDGGFDAYEIETNLYINAQVVRAGIEVNTKGRVTIKSQKTIRQALVAPEYTDNSY